MFKKNILQIEELKDEMPLEVIEVSCYSVARRNAPPITIEIPKIMTIVYTDGEIFKESETETYNIKSYYFGTKKYEGKVESLKKKNIYIKNHSFAVIYTIAEESKIVENVGGLFDVIKEVKIYLKDINDKKALQSAQHVIESNKTFSRSIDYSSPLTMELSKAVNTCKTSQIPQNPFEKKRVPNSNRPR